MSDPIIVNKKLFQEDPHKHCNPWEASAPPSIGRLWITAMGAVGKVFKVVCFNGFVPSEAHVFKTNAKDNKECKGEGKGRLIQNIRSGTSDKTLLNSRTSKGTLALHLIWKDLQRRRLKQCT